jgi:hypothetical protein
MGHTAAGSSNVAKVGKLTSLYAAVEIGLPEASCDGVEACERSAAAGIGIQANGKSFIQGTPAFLRSVSANNHLSRLVRSDIVAAFPSQHVIRLLVHWHRENAHNTLAMRRSMARILPH